MRTYRFPWNNLGFVSALLLLAVVKIAVVDSNIWSSASSYTYMLTSQSDCTTDVDVFIVREGKNLRGRGFVRHCKENI